MTTDLILFIVLATIAIASALGMLFSRNAVYAALFLILNFATVAVFYLLLNAPFIALAQVTVYAGAIMVLFLFVIMLLGAELTGREPAALWIRPLALSLGVVLLAETAYIIFWQAGTFPSGGTPAATFGGPANIGETLFNSYVLPFEIVSVLLLVAMIGAIVFTRKQT